MCLNRTYLGLSCLNTSFRFLSAACPHVRSNAIRCTETPAFMLLTWFSPFLLPTFVWQDRTRGQSSDCVQRGPSSSSYNSPDCNPYNITVTEIKPTCCFIFPRSEGSGLVPQHSLQAYGLSFPSKAPSTANSLTTLEKRRSEKSWGRNSVFIQERSLIPGGLEVPVSFICPLVLAGCPSLGHLAWSC